jgi:cellobiose phosphorylase
LWLILSVNAYVKETSDFAFLDEKVLYNDKKTGASVWEHLDQALEFTHKWKGPHHIALAGRADWNDTLNLDTGKGVAESAFTSMLFCRAALEMRELSDYLGKKEAGVKYTELSEQMKKALNDTCWDGEWYTRAYDDDSRPLGSKENAFGKIFINSQSWAVLGGVSDQERSRTCLDSVNKYLNSQYGIVSMYPAYTEFDGSKGGVTTYPQGAKENGGIFLHTNPWVMIAEILTGNGNRAFEYYKQILPAMRNSDAEHLEVEPYVYPQNILGKEHPQFGIGRNSWLSGTAAWNMVASSQYILGIRPGYDCLTVDPCIPSAWDGFRARRVFRGATYHIEVKNPAHVNCGVKKLLFNGKPVEKIPVMQAGSTAQVVVELG